MEVLHLFLLALDVPLVLHADLHLLRHVCRQVRPVRVEGGQVRVGELGPPQQGNQGTAVRGVRRALFRQKGGQGGGGGDAGVGQPGDLPGHGVVLCLHGPQTRLRHQADVVPPAGQPLVGVVLPEEQAVLAAGGHHPVGLVGALGDKIVDEGADVALRPGEDEIALAPQLPHGVDPGRKALDCRLLVPGRTVELPGTV